MAVTTTTRALITRWSAGTDPFTRAQMDGSFANIDLLMAIDKQGLLSARPAPGVRGTYYFATDNNLLYRDTGAAWVTISTTLTYGSPASSAVGDAAADGVATSVARSDHKHAREAFGASSSAVTPDTGGVVGTATTLPRSDHTHGFTTGSLGASASAVGDATALGTAGSVARADHRHAREAFGAATTALVVNGAGQIGTATTLPRSDHSHGVTTGTPGASAPGDTAAAGAAGTLAQSDHRHSREGFGVTTPAVVSVGVAGAVGVATTLARSDHAHGIGIGSPVASAVGDAASDGVATTVPRSDHKHAREAFGSVTGVSGYGDGSSVGVATTVSRSDHFHGTPALSSATPAGLTFGGAGAVGVATTPARADHVHAVPAVTSSKTIRIPHTFTVPGDVLVPSGENYYIPPIIMSVPSGQTVTASLARFRLNSGTSATVTIQKRTIGGTVTALATGIVVSTTQSGVALTGGTFTDEDRLELVVTAVSGAPKNMTVTVYVDNTV